MRGEVKTKAQALVAVHYKFVGKKEDIEAEVKRLLHKGTFAFRDVKKVLPYLISLTILLNILFHSAQGHLRQLDHRHDPRPAMVRTSFVGWRGRMRRRIQPCPTAAYRSHFDGGEYLRLLCITTMYSIPRGRGL